MRRLNTTAPVAQIVAAVYAASVWYQAKTNPKTGPVPTQIVGATVEETKASCDGCSLAPWGENGGCYAWNGNMSRGANSVRKATDRGRPADLEYVLANTSRATQLVRFGGIGDPGRTEPVRRYEEIDLVRSEGFKLAGYVHHRQELDAGIMRHHFLASCETEEQIEEAQDNGWLVASAGPDSVDGLLNCPNWARPWITCNTCGACDVPTLKKTKFKGINFPGHGGGAARLPLNGMKI